MNAAGLALGLDPAQRASLDEWDTMIDTNCRGLVTVTRAVLPDEFSLVRFEGNAGRTAREYEGMRPLSAADVADAILWCVTRPAHVTVNAIELMPTAQAFSAFAVHRRS